MVVRDIDRQSLRDLWQRALCEDGFDNDITSLTSIDETLKGTARIVARETGVFAGQIMFDLLHEAYQRNLTVTTHCNDSETLQAGHTIATITGPMRLLLGIERTLLNFLQRLCGVASLTHRHVDVISHTTSKIYDTRKTIPGWRQLDKYAVRCGGGFNHRMGLHDAVLIKDNHLVQFDTEDLATAAADIIREIRTLATTPTFVEFEVDTLDQFDELLQVSGIDVILLDNFTLDEMREAISRREAQGLTGRVDLEASGGVDLDTVRGIAETGVDRIAIGAITHSAPALDIAMEVEPV